ncbi:dual specificity protein phosphatase 18 isoform X3 [Phascolarctos cinereus]
MNTSLNTIPILFRQPAVCGLSQITSSLYLGNGLAANNKVILSSNRITTVINVSVESGDAAGPYAAALRGRSQQVSSPLPGLPHEVPLHVPAGRSHLDQVLPTHHSAQQRFLGAAHSLRIQTLWQKHSSHGELSLWRDPGCL